MMITNRRFLSCTLLLLLLSALAGCDGLSDAMQRPSPLTTQPPPPPPEVKRERQGGFTVLVDAPGQPSAERVLADVAAFARGRGFAQGSGNLSLAVAAPERYFLGDIALDITHHATTFQVVATLHSFSSRLNRKFVHQFYLDFRQQYGVRYGGEPPMSENGLVD